MCAIASSAYQGRRLIWATGRPVASSRAVPFFMARISAGSRTCSRCSLQLRLPPS
ncbi:hypothetical protein QJ054_32970 [Streptomyces sp. AN-3]|uniref:Uncharacterized protein n=1 Tax=Streptomyces rochei TaxID=1928 RepID=A0ABW7E8E3_STRRO|nr:hypothetical protein [Streptomyces sp. AN-3]MDI3101858.1 hypothetical protein [Streptomyces sp. AN-3]